MAVSIRVVVNRAGVRAILQSVGGDLERRARNIAAAAGPGHAVDLSRTGQRARAAVYTDTPEAMLSEATSRSLTRAIDAGRR